VPGHSPFGPAREARRLRNGVLLALAVKLLAILALMFAFFGPSHRPHVSPETFLLDARAIGPGPR
jgi:hypothetical protein